VALRFPTYDGFAAASVTQLFGADQLRRARRRRSFVEANGQLGSDRFIWELEAAHPQDG
jgi:hypothetical protein